MGLDTAGQRWTGRESSRPAGRQRGAVRARLFAWAVEQRPDCIHPSPSRVCFMLHSSEPLAGQIKTALAGTA